MLLSEISVEKEARLPAFPSSPSSSSGQAGEVFSPVFFSVWLEFWQKCLPFVCFWDLLSCLSKPSTEGNLSLKVKNYFKIFHLGIRVLAPTLENNTKANLSSSPWSRDRSRPGLSAHSHLPCVTSTNPTCPVLVLCFFFFSPHKGLNDFESL